MLRGHDCVHHDTGGWDIRLHGMSGMMRQKEDVGSVNAYCGWLYDALPMQAVWRPRLAVDSYCLAD